MNIQQGQASSIKKILNRLFDLLLSNKTSLVLLIILIISISLATFVENRFDTVTARSLFYNALWFEILLLFLAVSFLFKIKQHKLLRKTKIPSLLLHIALIVIIIGGSITRYIGFEGSMHLREGESSDIIHSSEPYFQIINKSSKETYISAKPIYFSQIGKNPGGLLFKTKQQGDIEIKFKNYRRNVQDKQNIDALDINISFNGITEDISLFYDHEKYLQNSVNCTFNKLEYEVLYGPKEIKLPFTIRLNNFTLNKYPGSQIPSFYSSEVSLTDKRMNVSEQHSISKNKVLDHSGYRFFQTMYDEDEKGTILSVNHDFWGTLITYIGYFLLGLAILVLPFSKKSRFNVLTNKIKESNLQRKVLLLTFIFFSSIHGFAATTSTSQQHVSKDHAEKFSKILVQSYDGRFTPINSLAYDVIHKISKKDYFNIPGGDRIKAEQLFLDMLIHPDFWKQQKIIYTENKTIGNIIGSKSKYLSYNELFDENNSYKLNDQLKNALNKKPGDQTKFDKAIIKLTERVNICIMTYNGTMFRIFPEQNSENSHWVNWNDSAAKVTITGILEILNKDFQFTDFSYRSIFRTYLISVSTASRDGNYQGPDQIVGYITSIQQHSLPADLLPSQSKIALEVFYNKAKIFNALKNIYAQLSIILIFLSLLEILSSKQSFLLKSLLKLFIGLLLACFIYHTIGMGLRWYLTGHAPWSNGYEALLLVAWGAVLAGLIFIKQSKLTLAATALLAFLFLLTAGHSYYDPQLTNLQPVLKSFWLIFHVAFITIGYAFLALGFFLGLINMFFFLAKSASNYKHIEFNIQQLTFINEKTLYIGLALATIGTFLGAIWANESWGRYWGWDPKETWSLVIILAYAVLLHFRLIPKLKSPIVFNIGSIIAFGSVIMTFVGVNYYFTKGLHSYASDDPPIFPLWAWIIIVFLLILILAALIKNNKFIKEQAFLVRDQEQTNFMA